MAVQNLLSKYFWTDSLWQCYGWSMLIFCCCFLCCLCVFVVITIYCTLITPTNNKGEGIFRFSCLFIHLPIPWLNTLQTEKEEKDYLDKTLFIHLLILTIHGMIWFSKGILTMSEVWCPPLVCGTHIKVWTLDLDSVRMQQREIIKLSS